MAKAKGKKIDAKAPKGKKIDAKAPKGKKIDDEFARPSDAPSGGDGWRLETEDHIGDLFLITPLREQTVKGFEDADTNVVVASIVHLDEKKPAKSEEHEEVFAIPTSRRAVGCTWWPASRTPRRALIANCTAVQREPVIPAR